MKNFVRLAALAVTTIAATPAFAQAVGVTPGSEPVARARIIRPLTLTSVGELNFGTVTMNGVTADRLISLDGATGAIAPADCGGGSAEVVCSGATSSVTYNVRGTNNQIVTINKTASVLTGSNGGSLTLTPTGLDTIQLTSSGAPGNDFTIGGEITIAAATIDGVYTGTVDVTVEY